MAHLTDRLSLVPFCDLADCPDEAHHAVGSPHFDAQGQPVEADPVISVVRADIVDSALPRASALAVSCNTRPYQSYGPVIRRVFECSKPNLHPELRRKLEGVMELGEVRCLPPGEMEDQISHIFLTCVASMTTGTNTDVLRQAWGNMIREFSALPPGSTLRVPLIGTGKARTEKTTRELYREVIQLSLSHLEQSLFDSSSWKPSRRVMLIHPFAFEAKLITAVLAERSVFLSILDKMGLNTTDKRLVYGIGHGKQKDHQLVEAETFEQALDHFDRALDALLEGDLREAQREAARGAEVEPTLFGMASYIDELATQRRGLLEKVIDEVLKLASQGRVEDAFRVGRTLTSLGGDEQERRFIHALRRCYVGYNLAELEAQLFYEKYMQAEESLERMRGDLPDATLLTGEHSAVSMEGSDEPSSDHALDQAQRELQSVAQALAETITQNAFHVVIRKLMAQPVETEGVCRAIDSLQELREHHRQPLSEEESAICQSIVRLANDVDRKKNEMTLRELQKQVILPVLGELLAPHTTYRLEEARYLLRSDQKRLLSRDDLILALEHLQAAFQKNPRDYGILSFVGFVMLTQGTRLLHKAQDFYLLWARLIHRELSSGRYRVHRLEAPSGQRVTVPLDRFQDAQKTHAYHQRWLSHVRNFAEFLKGLQRDEDGEMLLGKYEALVEELRSGGRLDLAELYEAHLGERWLSLMVSRKGGGIKIPIPFAGEISLDLLLNLARRFRRWRLFRKLQHTEIETKMGELLQSMRDDLA